jgi:hypothetical protein
MAAAAAGFMTTRPASLEQVGREAGVMGQKLLELKPQTDRPTLAVVEAEVAK